MPESSAVARLVVFLGSVLCSSRIGVSAGLAMLAADGVRGEAIPEEAWRDIFLAAFLES